MNIKRCSKCKQEKLVSEFFKSNREKGGYRSRCKICCAEDQREYAKTGYHKRYNREYEQRPEVKERRRISKGAYRQRPDVKIKNLARWYTNHEIRAGRINREPCAICGKEQAEAHHLDYNQPLIIVWLCADCHRVAHLKEEKEGTHDSKRWSDQRTVFNSVKKAMDRGATVDQAIKEVEGILRAKFDEDLISRIKTEVDFGIGKGNRNNA